MVNCSKATSPKMLAKETIHGLDVLKTFQGLSFSFFLCSAYRPPSVQASSNNTKMFISGSKKFFVAICVSFLTPSVLGKIFISFIHQFSWLTGTLHNKFVAQPRNSYKLVFICCPWAEADLPTKLCLLQKKNPTSRCSSKKTMVKSRGDT